MIFDIPMIFDDKFSDVTFKVYFFNNTRPDFGKYFLQFAMNRKHLIPDLVQSEYYDDLKSGKAILLFDDSWEGYPKHQIEQQISVLDAALARIGIPHEIVIINSNIKYQSWKMGRAHVFSEMFFEAISANNLWFNDYDKASELTIEPNLHPQTLFMNLNRRIRPHRMLIVNELMNHGLLDDGRVSMGTENIEMASSYLQDITTGYQRTVPDRTKEIFARLPMKVDDVDLLINQVGFDLHNRGDSFINVTSETTVSEETIFFSEKTFRPIAHKQPFIIWGSPFMMDHLRLRGYKTFSNWWDESYDTEKNAVDRLHKILNILHHYKANPDKWHQHMVEMVGVLNHNYTTFLLQSTLSVAKLSAFLRTFL